MTAPYVIVVTIRRASVLVISVGLCFVVSRGWPFHFLISGGGGWLSDVRKNNLTTDMQVKFLFYRVWGVGVGGGQQSFLRGGSAPRTNPLPLYIQFFRRFQSMTIDLNQYQSISINRLILIIDDQSMAKTRAVIDWHRISRTIDR